MWSVRRARSRPAAARSRSRSTTSPPLHAWTTATAQLLVVNWWPVLLYPQGPNDNATMFAPSLKLPAGWKYGTALPVAREAGDAIAFAPASLVTLIDSPGPRGRALQDDRPDARAEARRTSCTSPATARPRSRSRPEDVAHYQRLVAEALALFGARHYDDYHFLLTLSDHIPSNGLEHHESSDNRGLERSFTDESAKKVLGTLLSHEYVHSWNGKYRRPEGLVSGVVGRLPGAGGQRPALGLRGADRVLRRRARRAQRPAHARALPREPRALRGRDGPPGGPRVAPARGHGRGGAAALRRRAPSGRPGGAASTSTPRAS